MGIFNNSSQVGLAPGSTCIINFIASLKSSEYLEGIFGYIPLITFLYNSSILCA